MKKTTSKPDDEMRAEYDFAAMGPMVRGKYYELAIAARTVVRLDPDVAAAFPTPEAVNDGLRRLIALEHNDGGGKRKKAAKRA